MKRYKDFFEEFDYGKYLKSFESGMTGYTWTDIIKKDDGLEPSSKDHKFYIGEEVKINPNSSYKNQVKGDGTGIIKNIISNKVFQVEWKKGDRGCHYWQPDLMIKKQEKIKEEDIEWF
jgi:hypothetical protein